MSSPHQLLNQPQGTRFETGENCRMLTNFGAMSVADLMKPTLGPNGMDKIIQSSDKDLSITNDGATILKAISLENPAAKIMIDMSTSQDSAQGDGTTTCTVLVGELMRQADVLIEKNHHPRTLIESFRRGMDKAIEVLEQCKLKDGECGDALLKTVETALSSKVLAPYKKKFAKMVIDSLLRNSDDTSQTPLEEERIGIIKIVGGSIEDSFLSDEFLVKTESSPLLINKEGAENRKGLVSNDKEGSAESVLVANIQMDTDKVKIFGMKGVVHDIDALGEIEQAERQKVVDKVSRIISTKCTAFLNRGLVYDFPMELLRQSGVTVIENLGFDDIERLCFALDSDLVTYMGPAATAKETGRGASEIKKSNVLGGCARISSITIGETDLVKFSGPKTLDARSIVLRGPNQQMLEEAHRALHDAFCVARNSVKNKSFIAGGGASELAIARALGSAGEGIDSVVWSCMAQAFEAVAAALVRNAGFESYDVLGKVSEEVRAVDEAKGVFVGVDMETGQPTDMRRMGVLDSMSVKMGVLKRTREVVETLLRVDGVITCPERQREKHDHDH